MASLFSAPSEPTALEAAMRAARGSTLIVAVLSGASSVLMLAAPLYAIEVFDRILASGGVDALLRLTALVGLAFLIIAVFEVMRGRLLARVGLRIERTVSEPVIEAIVERRLAGGAPGAQPLRDLTTIRAFYGDGMTGLYDLPFTPLFLVALWMLHPWLGAIGLGGAGLLIAIAALNERLAHDAQKRAERFSVAAHSYVEATARNAEAVRAMGLLPGVLSRWRDANNRALAGARGANNVSTAISSLSRSIRLFAPCLVLGVGAYLAINGEASAGALLAAAILLSRALAPIDQAIVVWKGLLSVRDARRRLNALLRAAPPKDDMQLLPVPQGHVAMEEVSVYPSGAPTTDEAPILSRASFYAEPGEIIGVVGPSGAGKSTFCQVLVGAVRPSSGVMRLDGVSLNFWDAADLGPHIGYLPQNVELIHGSVRDNIARLTDSHPEDVLAAARLADVHEMILRLPQGYDTPVGDNGAKLSAGERQRIGLARALYGAPKLIVLDEPNANLDQNGEAALIDALDEMRYRGATIVIVAHRAAVLSRADRLLVLREGRVLFEGPRREILDKLYGPTGQEEQKRVRHPRPPRLEVAE